MIMADTLRKCAWLSATRIEELIRKNYPKDLIVQANFLGITNGGQFCYDIAYPGEEGLEHGKVFVYENNNGQLEAEY